jgi:succinate dehydrogenase (ubiquinone) membrane anchor subunit
MLCEHSTNAKKWYDNATVDEVLHATCYGLAVATPVAMILSPSILCLPVDLALGVIIPVHQHIGVKGVLADYVPPNIKPFNNLILAVLTGVTTLGLLKLNLCGAGITETVKSLWREPQAVAAAAAAKK